MVKSFNRFVGLIFVVIVVMALSVNFAGAKALYDGTQTEFEDRGINVKWWGAKGDGVSDDGTAIQSAMNYVSSAGGGIVYFPKGQYKCTSRLLLRNNVNLVGVPGLSTIFIDDTYTGTSEGWIQNEHYLLGYNDSTADVINIFGMSFEKRTTTTCGSKTIMLLTNIKKANINQCKFIHDTNIGTSISVESTLLDLYAGWKNVTVENSYFSLTPDTTAGGCMWVRNRASASDANIAENLIINNCTFRKKTHDEIIAIFTSLHSMRNIKVLNNTFYQMVSTEISPISVGIRASQADDILENLEIRGNKFTIDDYNFMVVEFNTGSGIAKNIKLLDNEFYVNTNADPSIENIYLVRKDSSSQCYNTMVRGNTFIVDASNTYYVEVGIDGDIDNVVNNRIEGKVLRGFRGCTRVEDNYFKNTLSSINARGAENCYTVINNEFHDVYTGLHYQFSASSDKSLIASHNRIYLKDANAAPAVYFQSLGAAFTARIKLIGNYIETINSGSRFFQIEATATWKISLIENIFKGSGTIYRSLGASRITYAKDNDWNGYNDTYNTELPPVGIINAFPVGHEIRDITEAQVSKWIRNSTSAGDSTDWTKIAGV
jgi:hypothetical protein